MTLSALLQVPHFLPAFAAGGLLLAGVLVAAHILLGVGAGILYFRDLWSSTNALAAGGAAGTLLLHIAFRTGGLGVLLVGASLEGAAALLALGVGFFAGRRLVMTALRRGRI